MSIVNLDKIAQLRRDRGWTMEQAADEAGLSSRQQWFHVESGLKEPTLRTLAKIAKAFGVKPGELLK